MRHTAIGIDIGGTNLRVAHVTGAGEMLNGLTETITPDPESLLGRIIALCRQFDDSSVAAIGVGVPGRVDAQRRAILSGGYINLAGVPLAEQLEQSLGKSVTIDNDCNMALVAEMATGAARDVENVVMFTIGTGIGGAIATDGRILRGRATAGQLGHLTVAHDGLPCACGRRGCVETTSSGTALGHLIVGAGLPPETRVDILFRRETEGDAISARVLSDWAMPLRAAIDSMVAAVDPDLVLLGGGLGSAAHRALRRAPAQAQWYRCAVEAAALGDEAGMIGAAISALASTDNSVFSITHPEMRG